MAIACVAPKGFRGNINQHMVVIKTKDKKTSEILASYINTDIGEKLANRRATGGTRPALDYKALRNIPIIYNDEIMFIMDNAYKIKKSNEKRAKELLASIDDYLLDKLDITLPKEEKVVSFISSSSEVFGNRFDPLYHTDYNKMKKECFNYGKYKSQKIKDIFFIVRGRVISKQYIELNKGEYPIYSSQTSNNGVFGNIKTYDFDGEYITWTTDGIYAGTCTYRKGKFNCTNICGTLKSKIEKLNLKYISDVLNQITKEYVTKVANPKLMSNIMGTIKIPLPPLDIQNEIASHIQSLREEAKRLQKEAKEVLRSAKDEVEKIILGDDKIS